MKLEDKELSMHAVVTVGLLGLLMATVVACGDMATHDIEIVIVPGSEQQVAEALRVQPSKLNRLMPSPVLANKIKDRLNSSENSPGATSAGDDTDDTLEGGLNDCPTDTTTEEIFCEDLAGAAGIVNADYATDGPACTCTAKSWCEDNAEGLCMCYTTVSNCG